MWSRHIETVTGPLPPRQRQVLGLLMDGLSEKQIARTLGISAHTIHTYCKALHIRFRVTGRVELVAKVLSSVVEGLDAKLAAAAIQIASSNLSVRPAVAASKLVMWFAEQPLNIQQAIVED